MKLKSAKSELFSPSEGSSFPPAGFGHVPFGGNSSLVEQTKRWTWSWMPSHCSLAGSVP